MNYEKEYHELLEKYEILESEYKETKNEVEFLEYMLESNKAELAKTKKHAADYKKFWHKELDVAIDYQRKLDSKICTNYLWLFTLIIFSGITIQVPAFIYSWPLFNKYIIFFFIFCISALGGAGISMFFFNNYTYALNFLNKKPSQRILIILASAVLIHLLTFVYKY